jgi:hypothetical protein
MARARYVENKSGPISVKMPPSEKQLMATKPGLYSNIHAKRARIAAGSGEKMRKPGTKGAPTAAAFRKSAKTRKK